MARKKLRFGILGAGRIGRVHAETLAFRLPEAEIVAIADVNQRGRARVGRAVRHSQGGRVGRRDSSRQRIDAVLICTSTDTHADLIVKAAQAGKHIFCEKPISLSLEKIDRVAGRGESSRRATAGGIQPALRFELHARAPGGGERRNRQAQPDAHHQPRSLRRRPWPICAPPAAFFST